MNTGTAREPGWGLRPQGRGEQRTLSEGRASTRKARRTSLLKGRDESRGSLKGRRARSRCGKDRRTESSAKGFLEGAKKQERGRSRGQWSLARPGDEEDRAGRPFFEGKEGTTAPRVDAWLLERPGDEEEDSAGRHLCEGQGRTAESGVVRDGEALGHGPDNQEFILEGEGGACATAGKAGRTEFLFEVGAAPQDRHCAVSRAAPRIREGYPVADAWQARSGASHQGRRGRPGPRNKGQLDFAERSASEGPLARPGDWTGTSPEGPVPCPAGGAQEGQERGGARAEAIFFVGRAGGLAGEGNGISSPVSLRATGQETLRTGNRARVSRGGGFVCRERGDHLEGGSSRVGPRGAGPGGDLIERELRRGAAQRASSKEEGLLPTGEEVRAAVRAVGVHGQRRQDPLRFFLDAGSRGPASPFMRDPFVLSSRVPGSLSLSNSSFSSGCAHGEV
jgi:hypothetical protein